jgi:TonB family protein
MLGTADRSRVKVDVVLKSDLNFKPTIIYSEHPDFEAETIRLLRSAPDSLLLGRKNTITPIHYYFELFFVNPFQDDTPADSSGAAFVFVEEQAMFQGGSLENYRDWVQKNLMYPPDAVQNGLSGRVTLQFQVNTAGKVDHIKILHSSGVKSLDEEALRLMSNSPPWTPAKNEGKKVIQQFVMPVIFQLQ